jgi:hypothetical protein
LSPRAIASDGSHVTMPAAAAPVPTRHVGAGLLPARRARVSARNHVEPGPRHIAFHSRSCVEPQRSEGEERAARVC